MAAAISELKRPRLLCLHGGGSTAEIFQLQLRAFLRPLGEHFRLVFADAPFICPAGPGMLPVFANMGPYRRWIRWIAEEHPAIDDESVVHEVEYTLSAAMDADDARGASGPFVGLIGFSQGAKMAASILYDAQLRLAAAGSSSPADMPPGFAGGRWRFALLMAGRPPLVKLGPLTRDSPHLAPASFVSEGGDEFDLPNSPARIALPTVHVHGLDDPGLPAHRLQMQFCCEKGSTRLIEWEGDHRVAIKSAEVQEILNATFAAAADAGVMPAPDAAAAASA